MMKFYAYLLCSFLLLFLTFSCETDKDDNYNQTLASLNLENKIVALFEAKEFLILPGPNDYQDIPFDINNPITEAKVKLGKMLFHETELGKNPNLEIGKDSYSCASCHHSAAGFQSGLIQGIGEGGMGFGLNGEGRVKSPNYSENNIDVQPIRSPSVLNVAYQKVMLWNGQFGALGDNQGTESNWTVGTPKESNFLGFEGVETQAIAGLDVHRLLIDSDFIINSDYKEMFDNAFPDLDKEERYSKISGGLAIAAYERTVLSNQAPFQKWLNGDNEAMSEDELEGAFLFFDKGQCYSCHSGPGLNGMSFHALGMKDLAGDNVMTVVDEVTKKGRGGFTGNSNDDYKFKTPQLYNLADVAFLGHGGSFKSVKDIIVYKNKAIKENSEVPTDKLASEFVPLNLKEREIDLLTLFIEKSLHDPYLLRYNPESLPSGNCFPNADSQSSIDMGCN